MLDNREQTGQLSSRAGGALRCHIKYEYPSFLLGQYSRVHGHLFSWNCPSDTKTCSVLLVYFIGNISMPWETQLSVNCEPRHCQV